MVSESVSEKALTIMRRCKCGSMFLILVILFLVIALLNLPKWRKNVSTNHKRGNNAMSEIWGQTLEASANAIAKLTSNGQHVKRYQPITCGAKTKPHRSIFYIKVHKTASTTLRSMLLIYGREYNLTVCMDSMDLWGMNWPYRVDVERLTKLRDEKCEIVAEELVYSPEIVDELMNDGVIILASVRDPVKHFISLFKYSKIQNAVEKLLGRSVDQWEAMKIFLKNPSLIQNVYATYKEDEVRDHLQINMVRPSLQLYSLGLTESATESEILDRISQIHFIVVAEHFDESMVILRDKLCCSVEDVVYRKQNVRQNSKEIVPEEIRKMILEFNKGDVCFYNNAIKRLDREIKQQPHFIQLMEIYQHELDKYEKKCTDVKFPDDLKNRICPPDTNGQIGVFVEDIRKEQRDYLLHKLRIKFSSQGKRS